jgi:dTDP-4-dehydrorhamnose 3,5-epimerase
MSAPIPFQPTADNQLSEFVHATPIKGLLYIRHKRFGDERGFYNELVRFPEIEAEIGDSFVVKQMNLSHSEPNVVRGFHAENWRKLLTVSSGVAFCAWADFRPESDTFGRVVSMKAGLGDDAFFGSIFVDRGIGNSFCSLNTSVDYLYVVDELYANRDTSGDIAISVFDPDLAVEWPVSKKKIIISDRDKSAISLREKFPEKFL